MLKLSALLCLLKLHLQSYENGNAPMPPESAGTIARLLSSGEANAKDMEAVLYPANEETVDIAHLLDTNVVSLSAFVDARPNRAVTPSGEPA